MTLSVLSPVGGKVIALSDVPDPLFAQAMVGPGMAVLAEAAGDALAPVDGTVTALHAHAFVITADTGQSVLVHLGIDTVKLEGQGFTLHASKGEIVRAGQPVIGWDPMAVLRSGHPNACPVIALEAEPDVLVDLAAAGSIAAGGLLFAWPE